MKKLLLTLLAVIMVARIAEAQPIAPAQLSIVVGGSAWTTDQFNTFGGALVVGPQVLFDQDRKIYLRTTYHRLNWGSPTAQSIDVAAIQEWWAGEKWSFFVNVGATSYIAGPNDGTDLFAGFGFERIMFTAKASPIWTVPFRVSAYTDLTFTDGGTESGSFSQINVGLRFTKPQR